MENDLISPGMDAIEKELLRVYPGQTEPRSYTALVKWCFGGDAPLDYIYV